MQKKKEKAIAASNRCMQWLFLSENELLNQKVDQSENKADERSEVHDGVQLFFHHVINQSFQLVDRHCVDFFFHQRGNIDALRIPSAL